MTPNEKSSESLEFHRGWVILVVALLVGLTVALIALALMGPFGESADTRPYAPYTAGPVVPEAEIESRPYAPYTAGPVVPEVRETRPYAPYTAGPVVPEERPYAPYTAGPVVPEVEPYAPYTAGPVVPEE